MKGALPRPGNLRRVMNGKKVKSDKAKMRQLATIKINQNKKGETMKNERVSKTRLLTGTNHPLLNIKEVMDTILKEAEGLPADVRQMLVQARDTTWKAFVEVHEKVNTSIR